LRYFIELSYNGFAYHGWQVQPNALSVQQEVNTALSNILRTPISCMGAGRTDKGVHAKQMFAHFDVDFCIDTNDLTHKLNSFLPNAIAIKRIFQVSNAVHARFQAVSRTYTYKVSLVKNVFTSDLAYYYPKKLDIKLMNQACKTLFNYSDFKCFSKSKTDVKTYLCDIMYAHWEKSGDELCFTIKADRFLRNMVRAIVGTMLDIGTGKLTLTEFESIINSKERSNAGFSVPGHALYLTAIEYLDHHINNE
jgi:tRNA pseudouridine38-40 synthase